MTSSVCKVKCHILILITLEATKPRDEASGFVGGWMSGEAVVNVE